MGTRWRSKPGGLSLRARELYSPEPLVLELRQELLGVLDQKKAFFGGQLPASAPTEAGATKRLWRTIASCEARRPEHQELAGLFNDVYLRIDAVAAPRLSAQNTFF
ncbi:MAG: hypothetical protein ACT6SF_18785 [Hydrogenophaga sp.]|uniref:hypothetical protein n=1 Tax=Hydrogenophaga sp. TaxID=1904254 RepID=UPI004035B9AB